MNRNERVIELAQWYRLIPWTPRKRATDAARPIISWKDRTLSQKEVAAYTKLYPDADWAVVPESTVCFDLEQKGGLDGRKDFEDVLRELGGSWDEATNGCPITRTKSGGWHIWYRQPHNEVLAGGHHALPGVECKAINGSCHIPPSFGYTEVERLRDPSLLPEIPCGLVALWKRKRTRTGVDYRLVRYGVGERRHMLCGMAGKLRRSLGFDADELYASLCAIRDRRCEDPDSFSNDEIAAIAKDMARKEVDPYYANVLRDSTGYRAAEELFDRRDASSPD